MPLTPREIKERVDIIQIIESYGIKVEKKGNEYECICPFHQDTTPSMSINREEQLYYCHGGCKDGGDVIKFVQKYLEVGFKEAIKILSAKIGVITKEPSKEKTEEKKETWTLVKNIPPKAEKYLPKKLYDKKIIEYYPYKDKDGRLLGYKCRVQKGYDKDILPLSWCTNGQKQQWRYKSFGNHIYGLDMVNKHPDAVIIVVEGERNKDDLQKIIGESSKFIVIYCGNNNTVSKTDISPLIGRKLILWADADTQRYARGHRKGEIMDMEDQPGMSCMIKITKLIKAKYWIVKPAKDKINGWDVSDAVRLHKWDREKIMQYMNINTVPLDKLFEEKPEEKKVNGVKAPFRPLGFTSTNGRTLYYYLPDGTNSTFSLSAAGHTKQSLLALAPIDYWEKEYPSKQGADYNGAINDMFRSCEEKGPFDTESIRGRGAWLDNGRTILHLGNVLLIDGKEFKPYDIETDYIYETGLPLKNTFSKKILSSEEGAALYEICKLMSWKTPISARLLSGWLFLSSICGVLNWRPHIWITGEGGTGKSWIMDHIISIILGSFCVNVTGSSTTEAGMRAMLGSDAKPVRWDEADTINKSVLEMLEKILDLARISSSNDNSVIAKATATGDKMTWKIRSMFLFSSVVAKLKQQTDMDRFTVLKLLKVENYGDGEKFKKIKSMVKDHISIEYASKMRSRAANMIPTLIKNIDIFSESVSRKLNNRRKGDQIGTLLAGCFNLMRDGVANVEQVDAMVNDIKWHDEMEITEDTDQVLLIDHIFESIVRDAKGRDTTIGQLVRKAIMPISKYDTSEENTEKRREAKASKDVLGRYGIGVHRTGGNEAVGDIAFVTRHKNLSNMLNGTNWEIGYDTVLERIKGTFKKQVHVSTKRKTCIVVPTEEILPNLLEDIEEEEKDGITEEW